MVLETGFWDVVVVVLLETCIASSPAVTLCYASGATLAILLILFYSFYMPYHKLVWIKIFHSNKIDVCNWVYYEFVNPLEVI